MVQCCWLWLVWIIWQLVWTSTWQLEWKVRSTLRCPMVLPGVRYWKLVESYGLQTHSASVTNDDADTLQTSAQEKIAVLEKTLAGTGDDEPILAGKRVLEKKTRKTPKKVQWPEENGKAHRGQTKLDQQRIHTPRVRECKAGGVARELESAKRNFESGLRGDQDSPGGPAERKESMDKKQESLHVSGEHGRNSNPRATRTGFLERIGFEETSWVGLQCTSVGL